MALLKRDHGIEVKSASSTIEEVVGRQFVERLARQRGVSLPGGDMFAERPMPSSGKKPAPGRKPEPPKPAAPDARAAAPRQDHHEARAARAGRGRKRRHGRVPSTLTPRSQLTSRLKRRRTATAEPPAAFDEPFGDAYAAATPQEHPEAEAQAVSGSPEPFESDTDAPAGAPHFGEPAAGERHEPRAAGQAAQPRGPFRAPDVAAAHRRKPAVGGAAGTADHCAAGDCRTSGGTGCRTAASTRPARCRRTSWRAGRRAAWPGAAVRRSSSVSARGARSAVHGRCRRTPCVRRHQARPGSRDRECRRGPAGRPGPRVQVAAVRAAAHVRPARAGMQTATRGRRCRPPLSGRRRFHARSRWQKE